VGILNPNTRVNALEFSISGIKIWNVENLADNTEYPINPEFLLGDNKVIAISYQDSMIRKYYEPTTILRVHYYELESDQICIEQIDDIVSAFGTQTITQIGGECWDFDVTGLKNYDRKNQFALFPNPASASVQVQFDLVESMDAQVVLTNAIGQTINHFNFENADKVSFSIATADLSEGIYLINMITEEGIVSRKLVVNH
jgi:Mg2+ and Co2+ transporter CorA